jgi:tetratricopeptide (TPR) repeat protein
MAVMDHPNIAHILDAGTTSKDLPYFVMELVDGDSIVTYCDAKRLTVEERIELFIPVCQAIQHAHQKGVIHRDIKPSNILVAEQDGKPSPRVIDFGLAKALGYQLSDATMVTTVGAVVGTPDYMSPEQAASTRQDIDTRTDIYSLGAVLYELLTGTTPLQQQTLANAAYAEILQRIQQEEPDRPSTRLRRSTTSVAVAERRRSDTARLPKLLDGELDWITMKALEKDRTRRYETVNGLVRDLQRYLEGEPVEAGPPSATYRMRKLARRHRTLLATAAAFATLLVVGIVVSTSFAIRAVRAEQEARAVNDFLQHDVLAQASASEQAGPDVKPDPDLKVRTALDRAAARIPSKFDKQPIVEASIQRTIAAAYLDLGLYPLAEQHLQRAIDLRQRVLGKEHPDTLEALAQMAGLLEAAGKWSSAEATAREVVPIQRKVLGERHPSTIGTLAILAQVYSDQNKFPQAEPLLEEVLEIQKKVLGPEHPETLTSMNNLALNYRRQRKDARAEALYSNTLELRRLVSGENHPDTLLVMNNLAGVYLAQSRYAEAEALFVKALEHRQVLGEEHPLILYMMNGLAVSYTNRDNYALAEPLTSKVLEVQGRVLGETHPATLAAMNNLGLLFWREGKFAQSEPLALKALELRRRTLGEDHGDTLSSLQNVARLYQSEGRFAEAESMLADLLDRRTRIAGADNPATLAAMHDLGSVYRSRGQYVKSNELLARTFDARRRVLGEDHPDTLASAESLADLYRLEGRPAEAMALLTKVVDTRRRTIGEESRATIRAVAAMGRIRLLEQKFSEAEELLRIATGNYDKTSPDIWQRFQSQSLLGMSLAGQHKFEQAEPLLLAGYQGMKARQDTIPADERTFPDEAGRAIVQLYREWKKPSTATGWERRLRSARDVHRPQHFLCFFPLPQGHGWLRPTFAGARYGSLGPTSSTSPDAASSSARRLEAGCSKRAHHDVASATSSIGG